MCCTVNSVWNKKDYQLKKCSVTVIVYEKPGRTPCTCFLWISVLRTTRMTFCNIHFLGWTQYITLLEILIMDFYQLKVILLVSGTGENSESTMEHCLNYFYIVWKPRILSGEKSVHSHWIQFTPETWVSSPFLQAAHGKIIVSVTTNCLTYCVLFMLYICTLEIQLWAA